MPIHLLGYDMSYILLTIPNDPATVESGKRIARAMDPDVGGYNSFSVIAEPIPDWLDADGNPSPCAGYPEWAVCGTSCTPEFALQAPYLKANPAALQAAVKADNDKRWPDVPDPSLSTIKKFTDTVQMTSDCDDIHSGLAALGLRIIHADVSPI